VLRFRNRFKGAPSEMKTCRCGRRVTFTVADGRETVIHELPWCPVFGALIKSIEHEPGVEHHVALAQVGTGAPVETVIIADGDSAAAVRDVEL
jgi:hypothetical protein